MGLWFVGLLFHCMSFLFVVCWLVCFVACLAVCLFCFCPLDALLYRAVHVRFLCSVLFLSVAFGVYYLFAVLFFGLVFALCVFCHHAVLCSLFFVCCVSCFYGACFALLASLALLAFFAWPALPAFSSLFAFFASSLEPLVPDAFGGVQALDGV